MRSSNPWVQRSVHGSQICLFKATPEAKKVFDKANKPVGTYGIQKNKAGDVWFVFYDSYDPWYKKAEEYMKQKKNPVLEMKFRYREEAFADGGYYAVLD